VFTISLSMQLRSEILTPLTVSHKLRFFFPPKHAPSVPSWQRAQNSHVILLHYVKLELFMVYNTDGNDIVLN